MSKYQNLFVQTIRVVLFDLAVELGDVVFKLFGIGFLELSPGCRVCRVGDSLIGGNYCFKLCAVACAIDNQDTVG